MVPQSSDTESTAGHRIDSSRCKHANLLAMRLNVSLKTLTNKINKGRYHEPAWTSARWHRVPRWRLYRAIGSRSRSHLTPQYIANASLNSWQPPVKAPWHVVYTSLVYGSPRSDRRLPSSQCRVSVGPCRGDSSRGNEAAKTACFDAFTVDGVYLR